jgi:hypothetical protein
MVGVLPRLDRQPTYDILRCPDCGLMDWRPQHHPQVSVPQVGVPHAGDQPEQQQQQQQQQQSEPKKTDG